VVGIGMRGSHLRKGACTLKRINGVLFSLDSLISQSVRHLLFSLLYLVYTEHQSPVLFILYAICFLVILLVPIYKSLWFWPP